jgi:hypothetical protein
MTLLPGETQADFLDTVKEPWWKRVLIAGDQFLNVLLINGAPGETMSSHAGRAEAAGHWWGKILSQFLNYIQLNHCAIAEGGDIERAQNVEALDESSKTKPIY